ncbi:HD-GYP domain-containing protein [Ramlibacter sp. MAHUQ-53]|uniref:HD-GYP domain-containing protein n=1 Tax=unclassified Ramlibacter TaxID=2617605 RepID=UPI00363F4227
MIHADFRQVVYALSDALDLVGVDDVAHGKRVGVMAAECARTLGLGDAEVHFVFDLGLLHDIGVSTTTMHRHLVEEFDWAGSQAHAIVGWELLRDFRPLAPLALPIRYHHTRWDRLVAEGVDADVRRRANLTLLADRVDAMAAPHYASGKVLQHRDAIRHEIESRSGSYFSPELVAAFMKISAHEAFWLQLEPAALAGYLADMLATSRPLAASHAEMLQLARIFAAIVDAKSRFTAAHSRGVALVARRLGERLGLEAERCDEIEIAGLLHDLGKLRVPDEILDKPAALDADERLVMNAHSFGTLQILRKIRGFEAIADWAADHHEAPGGKGYPRGRDGAALPLESRILRVADIFQAMVQDRPYRQGLGPQALADFMRDLRGKGAIDAQVVDVVLAHLDEMMAIARRPQPATEESMEDA